MPKDKLSLMSSFYDQYHLSTLVWEECGEQCQFPHFFLTEKRKKEMLFEFHVELPLFVFYVQDHANDACLVVYLKNNIYDFLGNCIINISIVKLSIAQSCFHLFYPTGSCVLAEKSGDGGGKQTGKMRPKNLI